MTESLLQRAKRFDQERPSLPGEHWIALAAGVALFMATRRHPSLLVKALAGVTGSLLVARALSGQEVPPLLQRVMPYTGRDVR